MPAPAVAKPEAPAFTPEVEARTAEIRQRLKNTMTAFKWPQFAPEIDAICRLKKERNAVILAHNYQTPEIFHGVADVVGDSLALARQAAKTDADVIVQAGVYFMAETAKLLNPDKTVLIPDVEAGCSLAASITGADVRLLREAYPGVPIVTYVNTSAEVKAESDVCCTSSNALRVVEALGVPRVILLPDQYLAQYVASQTTVEVIGWRGRCEVHEQFSGDEIEAMRDVVDGLVVIAHPECPPEVINASDFTGSTAEMIDYINAQRPAKVLLLTECSMGDNIAAGTPNIEFIKPCGLCPHMKRITLEKIRRSLESMQTEVTIDPHVAERARRSVERMLALT
ncbi:MAG: quinolinate synthase NadA [Rhodospirillales bacterium]|nr:quinolinate synthase NadA [Rhodospirillales bacterium]